jgi:hypothetical protein
VEITYPEGLLFGTSTVPVDDVDQLPGISTKLKLKLALFVDDQVVALRYGKFSLGKISRNDNEMRIDKREDKLKPDLQKKLEALKQTVAMLTETQAIRAKNGQPEADDLSQGMSLLRVQLHTLEKQFTAVPSQR